MFVANEVLAANKVGSVEDGNKLIEKYEKLSKTGKLSKSKNLRSISAIKECIFLTFDAKINFKF